jgi:hypothetical protein
MMKNKLLAINGCLQMICKLLITNHQPSILRRDKTNQDLLKKN